MRLHVFAKILLSFCSIFALAINSKAETTPIPYNSCAAPIYESLAGIPYTGVCENIFIAGKYVCQDFARDYCAVVASRNTGSSFSDTRCWVATLNIEDNGSIWPYTAASCAGKACNIWPSKFVAQNSVLSCTQGLANSLSNSGSAPCTVSYMADQLYKFARSACNTSERKCMLEYLSGHSLNVLRFGGQERLMRYRRINFAVVEPQEKDGSRAVKCTWGQSSLEPEIPQDCLKTLIAERFSQQSACGINYAIKVQDSHNSVAGRGWEP